MSKVHRHACPNCYDRPLCREDCTTEIDDDGARRGGTVLCDRCAALTAPPSAEQQLAALREAARAALAALDDPHGDLVVYCDGDDGAGLRCYSIASRADDLDARCDRHEWPELEELSYAPALRRLRALVSAPVGSPPPAMASPGAEAP